MTAPSVVTTVRDARALTGRPPSSGEIVNIIGTLVPALALAFSTLAASDPDSALLRPALRTAPPLMGVVRDSGGVPIAEVNVVIAALDRARALHVA